MIAMTGVNERSIMNILVTLRICKRQNIRIAGHRQSEYSATPSIFAIAYAINLLKVPLEIAGEQML